ncbi:MAG: hypothetical protein VKQ33_08570 [Candidatus Sericytochromatia bacterium]|nr:hypothetical protein [Candidatus Sericytochromatia bacterium]
MNFTQAMIVPSLVTMGLGSLMVAQNLSLVEAGYAAPARPSLPGGKAVSAQGGGGAGASAAVPAPASAAGVGDEVRIGKGDVGVLAATSEQELSVRAVEAAGREDPFLQLVPPDPGAIKVPLDVAPLGKLPPISTVALPPPGSRPVPPAIPNAPLKPPVGGGAAAPTPAPKPFGGDKPPALDQPQWLVRGIVSTGYERICMLEGRAGNNISARIGQTLSDGSVVEAISNRGVTFVRGGRRFVKIIGGIL